MPELPEVEVLVRHLAPLLLGKSVRRVVIRRPNILRGTSVRAVSKALTGARFDDLKRRGKYLLFTIQSPRSKTPMPLVGHLGMTGRMYLQSKKAALPKHAAVVLELSRANFVFEDTRYFGTFTLQTGAVERLGPEPLEENLAPASFAAALQRSGQPIKVKLLDQSVIAGVGNIYASEALFRGGISPNLPARRLTAQQIERLWKAIRTVLLEAISFGSTGPLNHSGTRSQDGIFYFGQAADAPNNHKERLRVYDRVDQPCYQCGSPIRRVVQAARSTFYCGKCQK
jgi:formamidopyrimidine-DNA glycosylase